MDAPLGDVFDWAVLGALPFLSFAWQGPLALVCSAGGVIFGALPFIVCLAQACQPGGTLRWARFLHDEKSGKESLRAFPPKDPPWGTGLVVRQVYVRPWFGANPGKQLLLAKAQPDKWCTTSPPGPLSGGLQPFPAAGSLTSGGWEQPQRQKKARTWELPSHRASCQGKLVCWHHQEQQETFRAVGCFAHCRLAPAGWIPQGGGRPRLWRSLVTFWRQKVTPSGERVPLCQGWQG